MDVNYILTDPHNGGQTRVLTVTHEQDVRANKDSVKIACDGSDDPVLTLIVKYGDLYVIVEPRTRTQPLFFVNLSQNARVAGLTDKPPTIATMRYALDNARNLDVAASRHSINSTGVEILKQWSRDIRSHIPPQDCVFTDTEVYAWSTPLPAVGEPGEHASVYGELNERRADLYRHGDGWSVYGFTSRYRERQCVQLASKIDRDVAKEIALDWVVNAVIPPAAITGNAKQEPVLCRPVLCAFSLTDDYSPSKFMILMLPVAITSNSELEIAAAKHMPDGYGVVYVSEVVTRIPNDEYEDTDVTGTAIGDDTPSE